MTCAFARHNELVFSQAGPEKLYFSKVSHVFLFGFGFYPSIIIKKKKIGPRIWLVPLLHSCSCCLRMGWGWKGVWAPLRGQRWYSTIHSYLEYTLLAHFEYESVFSILSYLDSVSLLFMSEARSDFRETIFDKCAL